MTIREQAEQAAAAARKLAAISPDVKNKALNAMADALLAEKEAILSANALDIEAGKAKNMKASLIDRLLLTEARIADMAEGLRQYPDAGRILAARMPNYKPSTESTGPEAVVHESFDGFESKAAAFADTRLEGLNCPVCGTALPGVRWINQGDQRYMNIFTCQEHGPFLARAKFRKNPVDGSWAVNKLVYEADSAMQDFYKAKTTQARRRGRGHSSRKNRPASKQ